MEPTSSTCAVTSLTCSQLALAATVAATGVLIIGLAFIYRVNTKNTQNTLIDNLRNKREKLLDKVDSVFRQTSPKNKQKEEILDKNFSLLLITTSEKLRGKIAIDNITDGECNQSAGLETVRNLINTSRYFLVDNTGNGTLQKVKTSTTLPDLEKDNLFILKITGKGKHDIATCKTKLGLRDSITSETCNIEKVLHLLDARIADKFVPTI